MARQSGKDRAVLDVLVAGAGYVGLAAAVSLKQARPSLEVENVEQLVHGCHGLPLRDIRPVSNRMNGQSSSGAAKRRNEAGKEERNGQAVDG